MTNVLTQKIERWAYERGLDAANPDRQIHKLIEEVGELAAGYSRNEEEEVADAIGDINVVLTILCMQLELDYDECKSEAYEEIRYRKGEMVNGVFVKESDL